MNKPNMKSVRASIVTYNTDPAELTLCVSSLLNAGLSRIAVVDNSPGDDLASLCKSLGIGYTRSDGNVGYGAAHNIELRRSLGDSSVRYHLVINSDVWFDADVIGKIVDYMDANPDVGQLIPRTVYPDGREQAVVRMLPAPLDLIGRRFLPKWLMRKRNARYELQFWNHKVAANVPYHQGSFMFFRTDVLRRVGLFDERFFMYPEDIDITRRIHKVCRTMFWPGVTIVHTHRASSYKSLRMLRIHVVNMCRYFCKWGWFIDSERRSINKQLLKELNG